MSLSGRALDGFDALKCQSFWFSFSSLYRFDISIFELVQSGFGRTTFAERVLVSGRIMCDIKASAREFIKAVTYEMDELVETQVGSLFGSRKYLLMILFGSSANNE